jgi:hypothetical protein
VKNLPFLCSKSRYFRPKTAKMTLKQDKHCHPPANLSSLWPSVRPQAPIMVNLQVNKLLFSDDLKPGGSGTVW